MPFLLFRLYAPLASWGTTAVGEERPSATDPTQSVLCGLLAAALGIRRDEESRLMALHRAYAFTVATICPGTLLRDYHTAQVPSQSDLKKRPHRTRADELMVPKTDLNTILSTRDYRQDGVWLIAAECLDASPPYSLTELAAALKQPKFTLYLGRKSCPLALPVCPQILDVSNAEAAFAQGQFPQDTIRFRKAGALQQRPDIPLQTLLQQPIQRVTWPASAHAGYAPQLSTVRKDRVISRQRWQFGDRAEHVALLSAPAAKNLDTQE